MVTEFFAGKTALSVRVSPSVRRILAVALLGCFTIFIATIELERKTLDPNLVELELRSKNNMLSLSNWTFSVFDCQGPTLTSRCKRGPTTTGTFPLDWPEAETFSNTAKGYAIAAATHELTKEQKAWITDHGDVSLVLPRNVQLSSSVMGEPIARSYGIGTASEYTFEKSALLKRGSINIQFDYTGLPSFGPHELSGAILSADSIGTYQSLPARQIAANHLVMQLGVGFPLFIAVMAIVLDHSLAFTLLSVFGILRSLRSFVPFWVENAQGDPKYFEPLFFIMNGLCFIAFILFTLEMTRFSKISQKVLFRIGAGCVVLFTALGFVIPKAWLTLDLYADIGMGAFAIAAVAVSVYRVRKRQSTPVSSEIQSDNETDDGNEKRNENQQENKEEHPTQDAFIFHKTNWNLFALFLFAVAVFLQIWVNAEDLIATFNGHFKTIIDWKHIAVFPVMAASALFEVGFTSKKVLSVAQEMTEKALIDKELQTAQEFQRQTLPVMRFQNENWKWRAIYKSASKLGGDWFDVRELSFRNGKKLLAIGLVDVTGHGIGAAMVTTIVSAVWSLWCKDSSKINAPEVDEEKAAFLSNACERLQAALSASRKEASGTGAFALLCSETRTITYCTVGHPAIIVTNNKSITTLSTPNVAFGHQYQDEDTDWKIMHKKIELAEQLIFYSDGIIPADSDASAFIQAMRRKLKKESFSVPTEFYKALRKAKQVFRTNRQIEDDMTLLTVSLRNEN